ncbi:MAG TPA: WbuC family cupin fold metalloprotein [Fibrobacteria bacterium]|nr:WbuC family cupin fold metalloprotein [Fibrobacteria bacterium]
MFPHVLDNALAEEVLGRARVSPRLRANHCFHRPADRLQRMVNAALRGSYFAPHRHKDPDKLEIFTILTGRVMVITFDDSGGILDRAVLSRDAGAAGGPESWQVEIPPGTWHTLAVLSPEAVLYEVIDGSYDAKTHKRFAPWAPPESDQEAARAYLAELLRRTGEASLP